MKIPGRDIEGNGSKGGSKAGEFIVSMNGRDMEAAGDVGGEDETEEGRHGLLSAVGDSSGVTEANVTGDGVEEGLPLDIEEINSEDDGGVIFPDGRRDRRGIGCRDMGGKLLLSGVPLEERDVGPVDEPGSVEVGSGDRAVKDVPMIKAMLED